MKRENVIDHFQDLVLELACVADVLTAIQYSLSEGNILPRTATDAVCAVKAILCGSVMIWTMFSQQSEIDIPPYSIYNNLAVIPAAA